MHTVTVAAGGTIEVQLNVGNSFMSINGLQVLQQATQPGIGTPYCGPANNNSTGGPATILASGSAVALDNDLTLAASGLPSNQFAIFITSTTSGLTPIPAGSQGNLCLAGALGRYNSASQLQNSGAGGTVSLALDLTQTPSPTGPVAVQAGETRYFQLWYRDVNPGPVSNFTAALAVTFL